VSKCRSCDAEIIWAVTSKGKRMPVDAEPSESGNVELDRSGRVPLAIVHAQPPMEATNLHMAHHATCPQSDRWKS
jgi:hypothetical protein